MVLLEDIKKDKDFVSAPKLINVVEDVNLLGMFPYETKRIRGCKVNSNIYKCILNKCEEILDNKIVLVLEDEKAFGTNHYFALFYHDGGCVIGKLEDITKY